MAGKLRTKMKQWHVAILALWVLVWLGVNLWPASYWLEVQQIRVFNSVAGQPVLMAVDRVIKREFYATWTVRVRKIEDGGWLTACAAIGGGEYQPIATLPVGLDLGWWTDGRCQSLPAGQYLANTTWQIEGGFLPDKTISVDSNIFLIAEVGQPAAPEHDRPEMNGHAIVD